MVTVGFEMELYSVSEDERGIDVCVIIIQGDLDRDATVMLNTRFGTATGGRYTYTHVHSESEQVSYS